MTDRETAANKYALATRAIHAGQTPDPSTGAVITPIYANSTYLHESPGVHKGLDYGRSHNPTRWALERCVADLEGGAQGYAFASGMAAIATILELVDVGSHIIAGDDLYGGTFRLMDKVRRQSAGLSFSYVDLADPEAIVAAIRPETKLFFLETPSNPLLRLVDIEALAAKAKAAGALVGIDNTFATPYLQNPLDMGCDIVFHSATKYLCGHSDVLMGIVVVKEEKPASLLRSMMVNTGGVAGPMDCALVLRGIKTLAVRMKQHQENALELARRLEAHPAVEKVFYPGLASHEHHALAQKQMRGFGGVVSVYLKNNSKAAANSVIKNMKLVKMAASLGGVESLVNHSFSQSHSGMSADVKAGLGIREGLLRFSVGIEDIEDIWADIAAALEAV